MGKEKGGEGEREGEGTETPSEEEREGEGVKRRDPAGQKNQRRGETRRGKKPEQRARANSHCTLT